MDKDKLTLLVLVAVSVANLIYQIYNYFKYHYNILWIKVN